MGPSGEHALEFAHELVEVFELAVDGGEAHVGDLVELLELVHDGMIESTSRGFVLRRYSQDEIEEIFEIRRLLEPAAAAIAAKKMTDAALEEMDEAIQAGIKASKADDFAAFLVANAAFRRAWMAQVPTAQLVAALARYSDHVQIIRLVTLSQRPVR